MTLTFRMTFPSSEVSASPARVYSYSNSNLASSYCDLCVTGTVNVQMQKVNGLTPCISRPGISRKSKGRRVTICLQDSDEPKIGLSHNVDTSEPIVKRFRHSRGLSGTDLGCFFSFLSVISKGELSELHSRKSLQ